MAKCAMFSDQLYTISEEAFSIVKTDAFAKLQANVLSKMEVDTRLRGEDTADALALVSGDYVKTLGDDRTATDGKYVGLSRYRIIHKCIQYVREAFPYKTIEGRAHIYYPPGGYMGWHTNSSFPGERIYIVWSDGNSFFRTIENGKVVTKQDPKGWSISRFTIPDPKDGLLWHCVYSGGERFSMGFAIM